MGNQHSTDVPGSSSSSRRLISSRGKSQRRLRMEALNQSSQSSGLYDSCSWKQRTIRRLIKNNKLAPRLQGKDERETGMEHNCPICMLHYDEINMIKCCKAMICTECYLQAQDPDNQDSPCPFCKNDQMSLVVARPLSYDEADRRAIEEQKVLEATIQAKNNRETATIKSSFTSSDSSTIQEYLLEEPMVDIPIEDDEYDRYGQMRLAPYTNDEYERYEQMILSSCRDDEFNRYGHTRIRPCHDEQCDTHERIRVRPIHIEQYERHCQISDTCYAGYEGCAQINERHFPLRNILNASSEGDNMNDLHYPHSMHHLNANDRNNDLRMFHHNTNEMESGLRTATDLFLSEISQASQLELAIQFSRMDPESPVELKSSRY